MFLSSFLYELPDQLVHWRRLRIMKGTNRVIKLCNQNQFSTKNLNKTFLIFSNIKIKRYNFILNQYIDDLNLIFDTTIHCWKKPYGRFLQLIKLQIQNQSHFARFNKHPRDEYFIKKRIKNYSWVDWFPFSLPSFGLEILQQLFLTCFSF